MGDFPRRPSVNGGVDKFGFVRGHNEYQGPSGGKASAGIHWGPQMGVFIAFLDPTCQDQREIEATFAHTHPSFTLRAFHGVNGRASQVVASRCRRTGACPSTVRGRSQACPSVAESSRSRGAEEGVFNHVSPPFSKIFWIVSSFLEGTRFGLVCRETNRTTSILQVVLF